MKSVTQTLKTLTLSLALIAGVNSVSFAANAAEETKMNKTELMAFLKDGGLPEGTQKGQTAEGAACELTINTKAGEEKLSMKLTSEADQDAQRLILDDAELDYIPFIVADIQGGVSITQDFGDSSEKVQISKASRDEVTFTMTETIGYDVRKLSCSFK